MGSDYHYVHVYSKTDFIPSFAHGCVWWKTSCVFCYRSSLIRLACCAAPVWLDYLLCNESDWLRAAMIGLTTRETGHVKMCLFSVVPVCLCAPPLLYTALTMSYLFLIPLTLFFLRMTNVLGLVYRCLSFLTVNEGLSISLTIKYQKCWCTTLPWYFAHVRKKYIQ